MVEWLPCCTLSTDCTSTVRVSLSVLLCVVTQGLRFYYLYAVYCTVCTGVVLY